MTTELDLLRSSLAHKLVLNALIRSHPQPHVLTQALVAQFRAVQAALEPRQFELVASELTEFLNAATTAMETATRTTDE